MSERRPPSARSRYRHFLSIPTRWADNDLYGHVNNATYLSFIDTVINRYLIDPGGLDIHRGPVVGLVVETFGRYHQPFAYPETVEAGLGVAHLGRTSVRYEVGLFAAGEETARMDAYFVHVWVDRATNAPMAIPERLRAAFERIKVAE